MQRAALPENEAQRLEALHALDALDTGPEAEFDALVRVASLVCGVPISLISLVDAERQWFKASVGLPGTLETPRDVAFCAHAILGDTLLEVPDTLADPRFSGNPFVTGQPSVRFYAGAPVVLSDGHPVGALCVIDRQARQLNDMQREVLRCLALAAGQALEGQRAMRQQAQSKERLRHLYEATPAMMHSTDQQSHLLTVSDRWLATLGYTRDEVIGRPYTDFLTPTSRRHVQNLPLPTLLHDGHLDNLDVQMTTHSGQVIDALLSTAQDAAPGGDLTQSLAVLEDVTLRKRYERALLQERHRLENILDGAQLATWEWESGSGALRLNERWADMLGYRLQHLGATSIDTWAQHAHPDDWKIIPGLLDWHLQGHSEKFEAEIRMRHREGHWIWVLDVGRVMAWDADGHSKTVFGTRKDITLRKRQEEALRKTQDFLERSGRMAGVGGWEVDLLENKVHWSAETCRIHGVDPGHEPSLEEAINFYTSEARPVVQQVVGQAIKEGKDWDFELPMVRADGQKIWVRAIGAAQVQEGQALRLVGAFQDVTLRVEERLALELANERMLLATESGGIGVWEWHIASGELTWSERMFQLYGLHPQDGPPCYERWLQHLHPQDVASIEGVLAHSRDTGGVFNTEFRIHGTDGTVRHLRASGRARRDAQGQAERIVGVNWDVTEARRLAAALAEQRELLEVTLRSIGDAVITTDAAGLVTWLNPVAEKMTGWSSSDARGQPAETVFHIVNEKTREPAFNPVKACLAQGTVSGLDIQTLLVSRSGQEYGIEDSAAPIRSPHGEVLGVVLVFHDVTEQRRISGEISYRASHDALTELVNRREFETRLQRMLDKTGDARGEHNLLFIDLDQFKIVNDSCGHAAGDELLQQMSKLLQEAVRHRDTVARLGGDEFGVILEHCQPEQAQRVAQQLCDRMDDYRYVNAERRFRIGASIGMVPLTEHFSAAAQAMQAADACCYAAKEAGRNRVHVWSGTDAARQSRQDEVQWTTRIEQALEDNLFELFAQQIDSLAAPGAGVHAEVLLRLRDPQGTLIPPGAFLPAAERFHLASRIDRWVLRKSVAWLRGVPVLSAIDNLSVNLSGQSVGDRTFHLWALQMLAEAGPAICSRLCLEITETAAITQLADAGQFIEKLRELGVKTALDDFGAGASSFGYLKSMPVDYLKIDGQFVRDLVHDPLDAAAVRCFIDVAKVVNMKTVAEFVDNPEVLQRLRDMGADYAQGFLLHRPAPIDELLLPDAAVARRVK